MRRALCLWVARKWIRSGLKSWQWRAAYTVTWYLLYPRVTQRRYAQKYHRRQLAVLNARKRLMG